MKNYIRCAWLLLLLIAQAKPASAQLNYDTVSVRQVSDGVVYYHLDETTKPWQIHVLEADLTNPQISIKTAKATNRLTGNQNVSDLSLQNSYEGHRVVGAINGDFFDGNGVSIGHQIVNGELVSSLQSRNWSKIAFDEFNQPFIERFNTTGKVFIDGESTTLAGVNSVRGENHLVLYNRFKGNSTNTNPWGTEFLLKPLSQWTINDTVNLEIVEVESLAGNMEITPDHVVLSAHGTSENFVSQLKVGDTLSLTVGIHPLENKKFTQLIGGFPKIVEDGQNYALAGYTEEGGSATFATDRHPRTSAGFNADSTKLFMFVVDGRQSISVGVSLPELADIMMMFGVHTGLNLDGGGSSTMVVKREVINSPSGALQRTVSNALMIVTSEEATIEELRLMPDSVVTDLSNPIEFFMESFDAYGFKLANNFEDVVATFGNPGIGVFSNGIFNPLSEGLTTLEIQIDDASDQSIIKVEVLEGEILANSFENNSEWIFSSDNIDTLNSSISFNNGEFTEGLQSLQLDYSFTYQAGQFHWAYLNIDIPVHGVPSEITVDAKGDGQAHTIAFVVSNENNERFALLTNKSPGPDSFEILTANMNNPIDIDQVGARFYYPIRIKQIAVSLGSGRQNGELYEGTILFDNIVVKYPTATSVDNEIYPSGFHLKQNYPNPFNPTTTIEYTVPSLVDANFASTTFVKLIIYDILGNDVVTLVNDYKLPGNYKVELDITKLNRSISSGIYFYTLTSGEFNKTRKLILLK